ncbi:hypothetical protein BD413DRAFT_80276 [Trametes elegans]|nr:hypothetical protein BD413DRAFT_80276 [Trametes elegans]
MLVRESRAVRLWSGARVTRDSAQHHDVEQSSKLWAHIVTPVLRSITKTRQEGSRAPHHFDTSRITLDPPQRNASRRSVGGQERREPHPHNSEGPGPQRARNERTLNPRINRQEREGSTHTSTTGGRARQRRWTTITGMNEKRGIRVASVGVGAEEMRCDAGQGPGTECIRAERGSSSEQRGGIMARTRNVGRAASDGGNRGVGGQRIQD